jgi:hypothetical protein
MVAYCLHRQAISLMMMQAASTCETLVNIYQTTRRNIAEDSHLYNRLYEPQSDY